MRRLLYQGRSLVFGILWSLRENDQHRLENFEQGLLQSTAITAAGVTVEGAAVIVEAAIFQLIRRDDAITLSMNTMDGGLAFVVRMGESVQRDYSCFDVAISKCQIKRTGPASLVSTGNDRAIGRPHQRESLA